MSGWSKIARLPCAPVWCRARKSTAAASDAAPIRKPIPGLSAWWNAAGLRQPGRASLQTRAEDKGDFYRVNGSKIWTSGADHADWMFCLVRTDPTVPKHEGMSFLLFSMDSPGVTTHPIKLINGNSPFCQTFFDNVEVPKIDLVHKPNQGWTVAKRLLQHERSGLAQLAGGDKAGPMERITPSLPLPDLARHYRGETRGKIGDAALRDEIASLQMKMRAMLISQRRAVAESENNTPGATTSIFNFVEAETVKAQLELQLKIRGSQAFGWEGETFSDEELSMCRLWLEAKAISIAGGSNEIQLNIIAKRVLGLPD